MQRIRRPLDVEVVAAALDLLPDPIRWRVDGVDLLVGVDPVFAGLHRFETTTQPGIPARSYRDTAHVAYPSHQPLPAARRRTTIVVPDPSGLDVPGAVHELGHVLHERLRFPDGFAPVTLYASLDPFEAFAEAFAAWVLPDHYAVGQDALHDDGRAVALFESLAA